MQTALRSELAGCGVARCRVVPGLSLPTPLPHCHRHRSTCRRSHRRRIVAPREATNRNLGWWTIAAITQHASLYVSRKLHMLADIGPNSIGAGRIDVRGRRGQTRIAGSTGLSNPGCTTQMLWMATFQPQTTPPRLPPSHTDSLLQPTSGSARASRVSEKSFTGHSIDLTESWPYASRVQAS